MAKAKKPRSVTFNFGANVKPRGGKKKSAGKRSGGSGKGGSFGS